MDKTSNPAKSTKEYTISIDRRSGKFAIFDDQNNLIRPFEKMLSEKDALRVGHEEIAKLSTTMPKVVYPMITKMRFSS